MPAPSQWRGSQPPGHGLPSGSNWQVAEQQSPSAVLPSSHCSVPSVTTSPQQGAAVVCVRVPEIAYIADTTQLGWQVNGGGTHVERSTTSAVKLAPSAANVPVHTIEQYAPSPPGPRSVNDSPNTPVVGSIDPVATRTIRPLSQPHIVSVVPT